LKPLSWLSAVAFLCLRWEVLKYTLFGGATASPGASRIKNIQLQLIGITQSCNFRILEKKTLKIIGLLFSLNRFSN
jgi:hypothetical protein